MTGSPYKPKPPMHGPPSVETRLERTIEERDRLEALLKQAHDREKWECKTPTIKWYAAVADYFKGR